MPGQVDKQVLENPRNGNWPAAARFITLDNWWLECGSANDGGQGFVAHAPNGDIYTFDIVIVRDAPDIGIHARLTYILAPSEVRDVHGNWVRYSYDSHGRLLAISANDHRRIDLTYHPVMFGHGGVEQNGSGLIRTVNTNGRVWTYDYGGHNYVYDFETDGDLDIQSRVLRTVTLPDDRTWDLDLDDMFAGPATGKFCNQNFKSVSLTHPTGVTGTFDLSEKMHRGSGTYFMLFYQQCSTPDVNEGFNPESQLETRKFEVMSVSSKRISGPGVPSLTWRFTYEEDDDAGTIDDPEGTNGTVVAQPDGSTIIYQHYWRDSRFGGKLKSQSVSQGGIEVERTEYTYVSRDRVGDTFAFDPVAPGGMVFPARTRSVKVTRGSDEYNTEYTYEYDDAPLSGHDFPTKTETWSSLTGQGDARTVDVSYNHDASHWILGLPSTIARNGKEFGRYTYSGSSPGRVESYQKFGVPYKDYVYHLYGTAPGALSTVTDAEGRETRFANYKRGIPRTIARADGVTISRDVDNNGWVTSWTDGVQTTTGFSHNDLGWLETINRPGAWADTSISYHNLGTSSFHQSAVTGTLRENVSYDGLQRPTTVRRIDGTGHSTDAYTRTAYTSMGRVFFEMARNTNDATGNYGTSFYYDALGRVTSTRDNVAPYAETTYQYLSGNRVQVTDPEGNITEMTYDDWGNMLTARQRGTSNGITRDQTQIYTYDNSLRLCRHYAAEHGSSLFLYNDADELVEEAHGQPGTTGCATDLPNADTITHTYDDLRNIDLTSFGDGSPSIDYHYDANGNIYEIYRGSTRRSFRYAYLGDRDLLKEDTLRIDGRTFTTLYGFTSEGHVDYQTLPSGRRIDFAPNGFGQPTEVRSGGTTYADTFSYHPNGLVTGMRFGNNRTFTGGLNARQQQSRRYYAGGFDARYLYDDNGRIETIDHITDDTGDRTFGYDGVGRLTSAVGPWGTEAYVYDVLGNIIRRSRTDDYFSDSFTRVMAYDTRGNITNDGQHGFVYDLLNQPVTMTGAAMGTFIYDGNQKRAKQVIDGETVYSHDGLDGTLYHRLKLDAGGSDDEETDFIRAGSMAVARVTGIGGVSEDLTYIYTDHLGSPYMGADGSGGIRWTDVLTPYGEAWRHNAAPAEQADMPGFTGHIEE